MKQTLPEQLRLAADNFHKPFRFQTEKAIHKDSSLDIEDILTCLKNGWEILPPEPLTFPDPPEGRSWWNPQNQAAEWFEIEKGFRPLLKDEVSEAGDHARYVTFPDSWAEQAFGSIVNHPTLAFRTKRPLPAPAPARVPLTAADVPPLSVIAKKGETAHWGSILIAADNGIMAIGSHGGIGFWSFADLMKEEIQILRPGQEWTECSKPAE